MPLHEYQCDACGHRFEVIRKFSDPPLESCPKCGGKVHKLIASPAFQFKGSGWYITDYAKKKDGGKKDGGKEPGATEKASGDKPASDTAKSDKTDTAAKSDAAPASSGEAKT